MLWNTRLQLESLDGRWLPDATPPGSPAPGPVVTAPVPPESALSEDYLKDRADLQKSVDSLHLLVRDYATAIHTARAAQELATQLQAEIDRLRLANQDVTDLVQREMEATKDAAAARVTAATLATGYDVLVKSINDQIKDIKRNYGVVVNVAIPELGSLVDIINITDPVPPPYGVC